MKNTLMIVITLAVLLLAAFGCSSTQQDPTRSSATLSETQNSKDFIWVVAPKFNYERIERWGDDLYFAGSGFGTDDDQFFLIDPLTGDKSNKETPATDNHIGYLAYDPGKKVWGHSGSAYFQVLGDKPENLEQYWEGYKLPQIFPVLKVTILKENPQNGEDLCTVPETVNEKVITEPQVKSEPTKYAIGNKDGLVSDFLFDMIESKFIGGFIAASQDKKWGIVDQQGNWIVEPVFEPFITNDGFEFAGVVSIDGSTFFARQDGKWGIIKIAE